MQLKYIYKLYIKRSSYVKRSNDLIKARLCSRCYIYHRLIVEMSAIMSWCKVVFALVHDVSDDLAVEGKA